MERLRFANGPPRPIYLDSRDGDDLVLMVLALSAEVSALRERLDTHERLAERTEWPSPSAVETYEALGSVEDHRARERQRLIERVTRALLDPTQAVGAIAPTQISSRTEG